MDGLLSRYNQIKRNGKKTISSGCIIRKRGTLLHVCLNSPGCRYRNLGSCTMCDYGEGKKLTVEELETLWSQIKEASNGMTSILIGSLGSVLDTEEVSLECLEKICGFLNEMPLETTIFETHYTMINDEICQWLRQHLPDKDIVIEVGLESIDLIVQEKCLNKKIDLTILESKIELVHKYGMCITANAFLGSPFLSVSEQIEDTEKTILWAFKHGVDSVVLFPANIRENTLLDVLYKGGKYSQIHHWTIIEVLIRIPMNYLNRIYLAWYGDWIDHNEKGEKENLPPYCCEKCADKWMKFYHYFLEEDTNQGRWQVLMLYGKVLASGCSCRRNFEKELRVPTREEKEHRIEEGNKWLTDRLFLQQIDM